MKTREPVNVGKVFPFKINGTSKLRFTFENSIRAEEELGGGDILSFVYDVSKGVLFPFNDGDSNKEGSRDEITAIYLGDSIAEYDTERHSAGYIGVITISDFDAENYVDIHGGYEYEDREGVTEEDHKMIYNTLGGEKGIGKLILSVFNVLGIAPSI